MKVKKILFSIIIPVNRNPNINFLKTCLGSIGGQKYTNYEIIIVTDNDTALNVKKLFKKNDKNFKIIKGNFTKSAARNTGARNARGEYLLHIDIDYLLPTELLKLCADSINKTKTKTIILHETIRAPKSIWEKARLLERQILVDDDDLSSPQVIEKKLFWEIGGFDERVDALDDWSVALKLKQKNIKSIDFPPITEVYEPTNIFKICKHRFYKGRYYPALKRIYGNIPQTNANSMIKIYKDNLDLLFKNPLISAALFCLKISDFIPFYLGGFLPIKYRQTFDPYQRKEVARNFDFENIKSNAALYKHYRETTTLSSLLSEKTGRILELGAGTGRITNFLTKNGWKVLPTDISDAMLSELRKKKGLPKPLLIITQKLPFKNGQFYSVISMRVIWHILNQEARELFLKEALRVAGRQVIMDFALDSRYKIPLLKPFIKLISPDYFDNSYYFSIPELNKLAGEMDAKITEIRPLEVIPLFGFNILPENFAKICFPMLALLETYLSKIIPTNRVMIKFALKN